MERHGGYQRAAAGAAQQHESHGVGLDPDGTVLMSEGLANNLGAIE
jgi:hypothetical protein